MSGTIQLKVARGATLFLGALAMLLGILFKGQNVAYMVGLAFAIAASANFPVYSAATNSGAVANFPSSI